MDDPVAADVERLKTLYRERRGIPADAPVAVQFDEDASRAWLYEPNTWVFEDHGTLDLGIIRDSGCRCRSALTRRLHRMWSWLRWGGWRR